MQTYNIYYKYDKLNKYPVNQEVVDKIKKRKYVFKQVFGTQDIVKIPTKQLKILKCTIL